MIETCLERLYKIQTDLEAESDGSEIQSIRNGIAFKMFIYSPVTGIGIRFGPNPQAFFQIRTAIPHRHSSFHIRKSGKLDWIAEHIFFKYDYEVGDKEFDSNFFVFVNNKAWGDRFFSKQIIRASISSLLSSGFHRIYSEAGDLKIDFILRDLDDCPSIDIINNAFKQLEQIITNFPKR
jgi:hypothetical protein